MRVMSRRSRAFPSRRSLTSPSNSISTVAGSFFVSAILTGYGAPSARVRCEVYPRDEERGVVCLTIETWESAGWGGCTGNSWKCRGVVGGCGPASWRLVAASADATMITPARPRFAQSHPCSAACKMQDGSGWGSSRSIHGSQYYLLVDLGLFSYEETRSRQPLAWGVSLPRP